jgi:hypothetical protein
VLGTYAEEARQVQARLDALRAQAGDFERSVEGDDDWADDDAKTERNNELLAAVNTALRSCPVKIEEPVCCDASAMASPRESVFPSYSTMCPTTPGACCPYPSLTR